MSALHADRQTEAPSQGQPGTGTARKPSWLLLLPSSHSTRDPQPCPLEHIHTHKHTHMRTCTPAHLDFTEPFLLMLPTVIQGLEMGMGAEPAVLRVLAPVPSWGRSDKQ